MDQVWTGDRISHQGAFTPDELAKGPGAVSPIPSAGSRGKAVLREPRRCLLACGELRDLLAFDLHPGHESLLTPDEDDERLLQG